MLIDIPRKMTDSTYAPNKGTWEPCIVDQLGDNPHWSAIVWCPECGKPLSCVLHTIARNGQITPSLGHPTEYPPCSWHTNPRLIGWEELADLKVSVLPKHECERCHKLSRSLGNWGIGWGYRLVCGECIKEIESSGRH